MAVRRMFGATASPRALLLNVGRCLQISEKEILPGPFGRTAEVKLLLPQKVQDDNGGREMWLEKSRREMGAEAGTCPSA